MFEEASDDNVEEEEEAQGPSEDEEDPVEEEVKSNEKKKRMKKPRSPTTVKEKPRPRKVRMARCRSVESRKIGGSRKVLASETMKHKRDLA